MPARPVLLDDRILIATIVGEPVSIPRGSKRFTTGYFYFRACRAFVLGAAGHLSGPFRRLDQPHQAIAMETMLSLPPHIQLPDSRELVPAMVEIHRRHPGLSLLNTEAVAAARLLDAIMLLTAPTASGQLAAVLGPEAIRFRVVTVE